MNPALWLTAVAVVPLAALFAGAPRYPDRALAAAAVGVAVWFMAVAMAPGWSTFTLGAWVLACGAVAWDLARRSEADGMRLDSEVASRRKKREDLAEQLRRLREETQRWEEEQQRSLAVYGLVKGLSEVLDWDAVRPRLEAALEQHLRIEEYAFYVPEPESGRMIPLMRKRLSSGLGSSWESLEMFWKKGRDRMNPHLVEDGQKLMAVPILHSQEMTGYLAARVPRSADAAQSMEKAVEFVSEIAFALRRVRLFQEVEVLSEIDGLTGVYRRHKLDEKLREETARAKVFRTGYCLMLLDIDHFKRLNDTYGHIFGDIVLKRLGEVLKNAVYETDFVARYGGEEFAILLPRAEAEGVMRKAEQVRSRVEAETFTQAMETVRATISIGIAHFPRDGATPDEIVRRADQALYAAKLRGRNRVVDVAQT